MTSFESSHKLLALKALLLAFLLAAGRNGFAAGAPVGAAVQPIVISTSPSNRATNVPTSINHSDNLVTASAVTATFSEPMDPATLSAASPGNLLTFTVRETAGSDVPGTVVLNAENTVATFAPASSALHPNTSYTAAITTAARSAGGVPLSAPVLWTFTTSPEAFIGQTPVALRQARVFAILTKSGVTDVPSSVIKGDVGASPITGAAIHLTCPEVPTGTIYTVDAAGPLPCRVTDPTLLTKAVGDMQTAYTDAAGRTSPNFVNLGAGLIGGLTLVPGLYKWDTGVSISTSVTLSGGPNDVWIFQISGNLIQASATQMILQGGALAKNIFWQTSGAVAIGTTAHAEGVILSKTKIAMKTGASANGRLLAQTAVTLEKNAVTEP